MTHLNQQDLNDMKERYESAKKLAQELWLDGDNEGTPNDFYYFQCGFVAGMNYKLYKDYTGESNI